MAAIARSIDRARARQYIVPADLRRRIERAVECLITTLDSFDTPDADLENGNDAEAFADDEEPGLGATNDVDQAIAWGRTSSTVDAEASETEDDLEASEQSQNDWRACREAAAGARASLRTILKRRDSVAQPEGNR